MTATTTDYRESLRVPVSWWLLGTLFTLAVWWAFFVATPAWLALVAGALAGGGVASLLTRYGGAVVSTSEQGLSAGRAILPWSSLGAVEPLAAEQTRRALGVEADARAYLLLRSYCRQSIRVTVVDAVDPTPYWLISTRHPEDLTAHLRTRNLAD